MPGTDKDIIASLDAYGVSFKKTKGAVAIAARADLLAGVAWLNTNHSTLNTSLAASSFDQQRRLADALRLDYYSLSKLATWPELVARRVLAQTDPGFTPTKRKAPDSVVDCQIK